MLDEREMSALRTPKGSTGIGQAEIEAHATYDKDQIELARTGKKQVLKVGFGPKTSAGFKYSVLIQSQRNFGFMSMLGFSCTLMATWEGVLVIFLLGFNNGGPAGLIYGFLFIWLGNLSVFVCMGELVSIAPTAGGQYHWVAMLAPPSSRKFLSYITGWLTCAGWQAEITAAAFFTGTLIQGMLVENHSGYGFQRWHGTLLTWAAILLAVAFNTILSPALPKVEGMVLVLHILGFVAILVPLVYLAPHSTSSEVFAGFLNGGGWNSQGLSFFIGLVGNATAFLGTDGAIHMCEEIRHASTVVPKTMIASLLINGVLAFSMLVAVLFCMGDITAALQTPTGYPFIEIFTQATASKAGATVMTSIIIVLAFCAIIAALAGSSRMTWSFARDRGLPGWRYLSKVDARASIPLTSIAFSTINSCLLVLINIGSSTAFNDVVSLVISCLYSSYLIACVLLLYRRIIGTIQPMQQDRVQVAGENPQMTWGPWHVHGALGIANNSFACVFLVILLFFTFWPAATPTTAATMNYSVLVTGFVVCSSVLYYLFWAKNFYRGPIVEVNRI